MADLISRDYLREIVGRMSTEWEYGAAVSDIYDIIMKAPAVDAVPVVHAYWVAEPDRVNHWHCSNCGCTVGIASIAYRYCYVCGAKMAEHPRAADGCGQAFSPD